MMTVSERETILLNTKLYRPGARKTVVMRRRLVERLLQGMHARLTLLAAPAGFGKSTLLAQALAEMDAQVGWVSLDAGDNDPARFWTYVCAALAQTWPELARSVMPMIQTAPSTAVLTRLLNELAARDEELVLALDDYHVVENPQIHEGLTFFLDNAPANIHVMIASRSDPPLPLARWRARGELLEVRAADLRFTADEAAQFLRETMGLALDEGDAASLEARTEGWAAGLQLAALALQGQTDIRAAIETFSGTHRHIVDYLAEEVWNKQPPAVRSFLLQTSVLERLSAALCEAVLDGKFGENGQRPAASEILVELERQNLFLIALDDERRWYRYHHLFVDLLRHKLRQEARELIPHLHQRAALWFVEHGQIGEAMEHALAAGELHLATALMAEHGMRFAAWGETETLQRWLDALPREELLRNPRLCVAQAWVLMLARQMVAMEPYLDAAGAMLADDGELALRGELLALRAHVALERGTLNEALALAQEALALLPDTELWPRSSSMLVLGYTLYLMGQTREAVQVYGKSVALCRQAENVVGALFSAAEVVKLQVLQGQLGPALASAEEALRWAAASGWDEAPAASALHIRLADVMIEAGELEAAEAALARAIAIGEQGPSITAARARIFLARLRQLQGDDEGATRALAAVQEISQGWEVGGERSFFEAYQARIWLMQGEIAMARRWAATRRPWQEEEEAAYFREIELLSMARVAILDFSTPLDDDRRTEIGALLVWLRAGAREGGRRLVEMEALALMALGLAREGRRQEALAHLDEALALGEERSAPGKTGGFVGLFMDLGAPMSELLAANLARRQPDDPQRPYVARLLEAVGGAEVGPAVASLRASAGDAVGLTGRELEVLRLLAVGLSGPEIAEHLVVSINTIKSQTKSIYSKLDAHSRDEALERARQAGLLT